MHRMKKQNWKGLALVIVALAVLVTLFAPSGVADERRLVVNVNEPFEVNGQLYPEGKVAVKSVRTYNPSSLLSEIWVGRECLGLFRASRISDDTPTTEDTLTFKRSAAGHLTLVGFASSDSDDQGVYRFRLQARLIDSERNLAK
jgi:hypothetical protein